MKQWLRITALCMGTGLSGAAAVLHPETVEAFDKYIRGTESRLDGDLHAGRPFLWADFAPGRAARARAGEIVIHRWNQTGEIKVPGGLIHDWIGTAFIPNTTLDKTLALVQDYNNHKNIYKPEVIDSRLVSRQGYDFKIFYRLLKKKVITVVLNTDHDVHYVTLDRTRCYSRSYSTRISEVEDPGEPGEKQLPPGEGHGFLWRLDSFWKFQERDGGVWVECQAISLTRGVPSGLGWLIEPIIRNLPRESLANTLQATRNALKK